MRRKMLKVLALTIYFAIATLVTMALATGIIEHILWLNAVSITSFIYLGPCGVILIASLSEDNEQDS